ncbi:VOC family protein [Azohydromonas caseinilytica]|uniref:VOC family protein n=1 Tax=Azohydromonas caseinilytica TaxID=2728836 RepID=A0A848FJC8_9BURK|nr:VOC family protein [Azohydromonas caseinilytica]NML18320.1 VOC family protein [Azohydromonas caseinilytica]
MANPVKKIPDGYTAVTPYLTIRGAARAIEFYKQAFGAEEVMRLASPDGRVMHAEIHIGGAVLMLHDEAPQCQAFSPQTLGGSPCSVILYVEDVDAVVKRAVEAGATLTMEVADQFYGDRAGALRDPFGHRWHVATHVRDVPEEEIRGCVARMFETAQT